MSYVPNIPQWIKVTKTFANFSLANATNSIDIYTLPAKGVVMGCQIFPTTVFSGGIISAYTISVAGNLTKYQAAVNVFTGAALTGNTNPLMNLESISGATTIQATAIAVTGLLNAATQGSVDIWLLVALLP